MLADPQNPNDAAARWIEQLGKYAVDEPGWTEAVEALHGLGFFIVPKLIDALDTEDSSTRRGITKALHRMGPTALYDVIDALAHDSSTVRGEALGFLHAEASRRELTITNVVPVLIDALKDRESSVRLRTAQALCLLAKKVQLAEKAQLVVPALVEVLQDEESYVRQWVAAALGAIGPAAEAAIPALTEALLDDDEYVRDEASQALNRIQPRMGY